jgi:hypothetical protein
MGTLDGSCTLDTSAPVTVLGGVTLKGDYNASTNSPDLDSSPISCIKKGDQYVISSGGTFFTEAIQAGDSIISRQDCPTSLTHWIRVENNLTADPFARANHTGNQIASTISDFDTEVANNSAVTLNTAKTGITSGQASAITANTSKITYPSADSTKLSGIACSANNYTHTTNANLTGDITSTGNATSIASGVIVNTDVNSSAAITYSKLSLTGNVVATTDLSATGTKNSTTFLRGDDTWAVVDASPLTTKGDVYTYDTGNQRLAVGTNGQVLKADSTQATGLIWGSGGGGATIDHTFTNTTTTGYTGTASSFGSVGVGDRDIYIKKIDANNEGVFTKIWKNGAAVEVQIA